MDVGGECGGDEFGELGDGVVEEDGIFDEGEVMVVWGFGVGLVGDVWEGVVVIGFVDWFEGEGEVRGDLDFVVFWDVD